MAKVRVYELAKELGVESKTVLTMLKDMGEFVRSASSTVEAPVERRLKEKLASEPPPAKKTAKKAAARPNGRRGASAAATTASDAAVAPSRPPRSSRAAGRAAPRGTRRRRPGTLRSRPAATTRRRGRPPAPRPTRSVRRPRRPSAPDAPPGPRRRPAVPADAGTTGQPARRLARGPDPVRPAACPAPAHRAVPGTPRPGNNPFATSQGMGTLAGASSGAIRCPSWRSTAAGRTRPGCRTRASAACRACPGPTRR